jgi:chromate transporter
VDRGVGVRGCHRRLQPPAGAGVDPACDLLRGPRRRLARAIVGGAGFILPGLAVILGLAALFLSGSEPEWARALGAGGGAAVAAVAGWEGVDLMGPSWQAAEARRLRWAAYVGAGAAAAVPVGPWLVVVLLGCGIVELAVRRGRDVSAALALLVAGPTAGGWGALAWTAFKVGGLSYGGGFVIIPLMQADAVSRYHWMTSAEFLEAVALGQITPGPVTQTVAVVGYAAFGVAGGLAAAAIAFSPSFILVLLGRRRFDRIRTDRRARAFLEGAGPAAIGAILGAAVPLAGALTESWQYGVLAAAAVGLLVVRRSVLLVLLAAAAIGLVLMWAGATIPG